jgi:hypothetical protein
MNTFIYPQALVETDQIGADTKIWAFAHVMAGAPIKITKLVRIHGAFSV